MKVPTTVHTYIVLYEHTLLSWNAFDPSDRGVPEHVRA